MPNESDWENMIRLLKYLNGTRKKCLSLKIDKINVLKWYVDLSFGVHADFKSHTGGIGSSRNNFVHNINSDISSAPTNSASNVFLVFNFCFLDIDISSSQ